MPPRCWEAFFCAYSGGSRHLSSFSAQQLRQGLGMFRFATLRALWVFDHAFRPGLSYTVAGIGLDRFDD
jgi:hypothetical protein